jgi:putative ABC transport system permease protein
MNRAPVIQHLRSSNNFLFMLISYWWVFGLSGIIALLIAFATISLQALRPLVENPVKSLRSE